MKREQAMQYVMLGLVCLLLLVSGVQAVQIAKLTSEPTTGSVAAPQAKTAPQTRAPATAPAMVGGC